MSKNQFSIYLEDVEKQELERRSSNEDRSLNQYVVRVLREHLAQTGATVVLPKKRYDLLKQQAIQSAV